MPSHKMRSYLIPLRPSRWFGARTSHKPIAHPGPMYNILRWFGNLVGERSKGIEVRARDLEQGVGAAPNDSSSDLLYTDREETPLSSHLSVDDLSLSQTSGPPRHEPSDEAPAQNNSEATQKSYYAFTQENKIAVMRNIVSILLTEDTLRLMGKTIVEKKTYQNYEIEYEQMKRQAAVGEAFIEVQQSKMDDVNLTEDFREHVRQDIQNARPRVLEDIRCRDEMERELSTLKTSLEYTRGQMDDIMETLMIDVGILERTAPEHQADEQRTSYDKDRLSEEYPHPEEVSESNGTGDTIHEARTYESTVSATESATESSAWKARVRLETAVSRLILAEDQFERRQEGYYEDVSEYGHDHTRTEIDHFHFRKGAELTRELRDAEDEYYEARAEAMALDLLNNTANQEFDFADEESDGYRESEDPICDVDQVDRSFIEAWTAKVQADQGEQDPETPAVEWDAKSVEMSESVSVINGCTGWRRAIDKWHSQQESIRAQFEVLPEIEQ